MAELGTRKLGNTGITTRAVGLGCAWFGSDKSSDRDTVEGVRRAIELGIDFLDTSAGYGESERRVGLAPAMQFCLAVPIDGIVIPGPYNRQKVEEAHAAVPPEVWQAFRDEFGVGL